MKLTSGIIRMFSSRNKREALDRTSFANGSGDVQNRLAERRHQQCALLNCGLTLLCSGAVFWTNRFALSTADWGSRMPMGELAHHLQLLAATACMFVIVATCMLLLYFCSSRKRYYIVPVALFVIWMVLAFPVLARIR
jgi:hypothetical protein